VRRLGLHTSKLRATRQARSSTELRQMSTSWPAPADQRISTAQQFGPIGVRNAVDDWPSQTWTSVRSVVATECVPHRTCRWRGTTTKPNGTGAVRSRNFRPTPATRSGGADLPISGVRQRSVQETGRRSVRFRSGVPHGPASRPAAGLGRGSICDRCIRMGRVACSLCRRRSATDDSGFHAARRRSHGCVRSGVDNRRAGGRSVRWTQQSECIIDRRDHGALGGGGSRTGSLAHSSAFAIWFATSSVASRASSRPV